MQTWLPGVTATTSGVERSAAFVHDLVVLVRAIRGADTGGRHFAGTGRGRDLKDSDEWMKVCFQESEDLLPVARLRTLWPTFRGLPAAGSAVMNYADLIPGNLLVDGDRLIGVLDGGGFAPAAPSLDLVSAWHMLDERGANSPVTTSHAMTRVVARGCLGIPTGNGLGLVLPSPINENRPTTGGPPA